MFPRARALRIIFPEKTVNSALIRVTVCNQTGCECMVCTSNPSLMQGLSCPEIDLYICNVCAFQAKRSYTCTFSWHFSLRFSATLGNMSKLYCTRLHENYPRLHDISGRDALINAYAGWISCRFRQKHSKTLASFEAPRARRRS